MISVNGEEYLTVKEASRLSTQRYMTLGEVSKVLGATFEVRE